MALALNAVYVVHERRIRRVFSGALAAGAFTTLSCYTILDTDGSGVSPTINAAFTIVGDAQSPQESPAPAPALAARPPAKPPEATAPPPPAGRPRLPPVGAHPPECLGER